MRGFIPRFLADQRGATSLEYGLIAALVFLVALGAITAFADTGSGTFNAAMNGLTAAMRGR
ncbi:MAG: Flp family type IVb pilin [Brevundimonas sp.]|uniref:Flp family type IVb pilin n=1 Tax=Brevundimonas sp. TaxID=1871086 RepID=UPI00391D7178